MKLDIQTTLIEPRRHTFSNVARRLGDKPASRYDEATLDLQATANFHYRPLWDARHELFDAARTTIVMQDWYALRDVRQYYYGTYNITRAAQQSVATKSFEYIEKRDALSTITPEWRDVLARAFVPFRHYEWGANMNSWNVADQGYGTAITSAAAFTAMDRLGMAQHVSRIGLVLGGQGPEVLQLAKKAWLDDAHMQPVRHMLEDSFVIADWFECFVAQQFVMDGILHPLVYQELETAGAKHGATSLGMLCELMTEWFGEHVRWVDGVLDVAAKESARNRAQLTSWIAAWRSRTLDAARAVATFALGDASAAALDRSRAHLDARLDKLGLGANS